MKMRMFITYWNNFVHFPFHLDWFKEIDIIKICKNPAHIYWIPSKVCLRTRTAIGSSNDFWKHPGECSEIKMVFYKIPQDGSEHHRLYNYVFTHQYSCGCLNDSTLWQQRTLACGVIVISITRVIFLSKTLKLP